MSEHPLHDHDESSEPELLFTASLVYSEFQLDQLADILDSSVAYPTVVGGGYMLRSYCCIADVLTVFITMFYILSVELFGRWRSGIEDTVQNYNRERK